MKLTNHDRQHLRLLLACLIVLAGFGLRVYRLDNRDFSWDEGWGVVLARLSLGESLRQTASDEHPPLYFWSLHVWRQLAGERPFVVRFPSVLAGTLNLVVLYRTGRRFGGSRVGLLAALLLALNRSHIAWSQEVKMYAQASLLSLTSFWYLLHWASPKIRWSTVLGYGLAALGTIFSHYLGLLVLGAQSLAGLWWCLEQVLKRQPGAGRRLARWLALQAALAALVTPWGLYLIYGATHPEFTAPPLLPVALYIQVVATVLTVSMSIQLDRYLPAVGLMLFASLAWLPDLRSRRPIPSLGSRSLVLVLFLPLLLIYLLAGLPSAVLFAPKFDSRYLLILTPLAMLAVAGGLAQWQRGLSRWRGGRTAAFVLAGLVLLIQIDLLPGYYQYREKTADFATLMHSLNNLAGPRDGIVVYTDRDWPVFAYYKQVAVEWAGIPSRANLTPAEVASRIDPIATRHRAIWVIISPDSVQLDPQRTILKRLAQHYPLAADLQFGHYRLQLFTAEARVLTELQAQPQPDTRLAVDIPSAPGLRFLGYDLPVREIAPGYYFPIDLYWAIPPRADRYNWRLQFLDQNHRLLHQTSGDLNDQANFFNTVLPISAQWESGQYQLQVVVASEQTGSPVVTIPLAEVMVRNNSQLSEPPARIDNPLAANFGKQIWLEGSSALPSRLSPGETLAVTLYWRALAAPSVNYSVFVHLVGSQINPANSNFLWGQVDQWPLNGRGPTSGWFADQTISDPYHVQLSSDAASGTYRVEVGLYDASSGIRLPVTAVNGETTDHIDLGTLIAP